MGKPNRRWEENIQTYLKGSTDRRRELDLNGSECGPTTVCCENGDGPRFQQKTSKLNVFLCKPSKYTAE
jgi:hypothetical protein